MAPSRSMSAGSSRRSPKPGLAILLCISSWVLLASGACSSSSKPGSTSCAKDPVPPSQDPFCTALAAYDGRCGHCEDCTAKNLQNCAKLSATVSDAYRAAFVACHDTATCAADLHADTCIVQRMQAATPTAAQLDAKNAYCRACGTSTADCDGFFSAQPATVGAGAGYNVLVYGDDVAKMAVTTCATTCDPFRYAVCVALLSCGPSGGDYCADGGLCAAH